MQIRCTSGVNPILKEKGARSRGRSKAFKYWSKTSRILVNVLVKYWSSSCVPRGRTETGQIMAEYWSNTGHRKVSDGGEEGKYRPNTGQVLVKYRTNTGQILIKVTVASTEVTSSPSSLYSCASGRILVKYRSNTSQILDRRQLELPRAGQMTVMHRPRVPSSIKSPPPPLSAPAE